MLARNRQRNKFCSVLVVDGESKNFKFSQKLRKNVFKKKIRATGYVTMKVGKAAALALGGGIILLQLAHQQGYITVDWNKVTRKFDKVTDKVTEAVTHEKPGLLDKVIEIFTFFILFL